MGCRENEHIMTGRSGVEEVEEIPFRLGFLLREEQRLSFQGHKREGRKGAQGKKVRVLGTGNRRKFLLIASIFLVK